MDWGTVLAVLVAMAIFIGAAVVAVATGSALLMRVMFRRTAETPRCLIPGCPFAKAMEDALHEAEREEPIGEDPPEAVREKVAV